MSSWLQRAVSGWACETLALADGIEALGTPVTGVAAGSPTESSGVGGCGSSRRRPRRRCEQARLGVSARLRGYLAGCSDTARWMLSWLL